MISLSQDRNYSAFRKNGEQYSDAEQPLSYWMDMGATLGDPVFRAGGVWIYQLNHTGENLELHEV